MDAPDSPRRLMRQWTALLLAPVAWVAALGILFPLTEDACARNSRTAFYVIITVCLLSAFAGTALAWRERSRIEGHGAADRAGFLTEVAIGISVIFGIVLALMVVPVLMLGACRT